MKKRILSMALASTLLLGVLAACAPTAQAPAPAQQATPAPAGQAAPAAAPATPPPPPAEAGPSGSLTIAMHAETQSVAPARHNSSIAIPKNFMTHERLFHQHHETLEPVAHLVADWTAISDTLFEFTLHDNINFSNGEPMTAADVVASWHWVRETPDARGVHISAVGIEEVDTYTFRIDTGTPNASFFFDLTSHGNSVLPKSLIDSGHDFQADPVGSGPFVFEEWRSGDFLRFSANQNYWNPDRAARIDEIIWRIIPEGASRTIALETGEVDFIDQVAFPDFDRLNSDPNVYVSALSSPVLNFINLNHQRPQFENVYARRAIHMAINQEEIVEAVYNGLATAHRAQTPIVFAGSTNEGAAPFDPEGAAALLAEHNIDPASLAFDIISANEENRRASEIIQAQLGEIGIPITITMMDPAARFDTVTQGNFDAAHSPWAAGWIISILRNQFLVDETIQNRNMMNNPEINELITRGIATIDAGARAAIFEEATRVANEYMVMIPSHLEMTIRAFNANLVAPELSGLSTIHNLNMAYWTN